ncbi:digestive cysteine proteinase 2 isoform X2 [Halyomorpha halys]|nr:digestive cysteine proteinase 2-like isoform X2 [Halyomorpha halys]
MKIVLLLIVVAACYAFPTPDDWEDYKVKFNKSYPDPAEDLMRKGLFQKSQQFVEEHNKKYEAGLVTHMVGINQFSDQTQEELSRPCLLVEE